MLNSYVSYYERINGTSEYLLLKSYYSSERTDGKSEYLLLKSYYSYMRINGTS